MSNAAWPLIGHGGAEELFYQAVKSAHLHHGWILEGPSGIGKSLLAKRMSACVLGANLVGENSLDAYPSDPIIQKLEAGSHPDFRWLSRKPDDKGKVKQDIPVDEIRELNHFFSLKSGLGGWRVGVIDSLDELNKNGSNALLKTLEEPPLNCLLILISHGTRPILPTIISRCRTIRLQRLNDEDVISALKIAGADDARATAKVSRGRPGQGLLLSTPNGMAASSATRSFLRALPRPSDSLLAQVIRTAGVDAVSFDAFYGEVLEWLDQEAVHRSSYAGAWLKLTEMISETRSLNMDRIQAASKILSGLQTAASSR